MTHYTDPIITKYIDLIKANTGVFKAFYQGEPLRVPASLLPCCIISKSESEVRHFTNTQDEHAIALTITVITDLRKDLSTESGMENAVAGIATLYDIMEGRQDDYTLKDTSILDILRANSLVDAANNLRTDLSGVTRVDYGETLRARSPEEWSIEAKVQLVAHFVQTR